MACVRNRNAFRTKIDPVLHYREAWYYECLV